MLSGKEKGMKTFIIALLTGFLFVSCNKTNRSPQDIVTGNWELRQAVGGIAGTISYEPGAGQLLILQSDKKFHIERVISTGMFPLAGTYEIKESARPGDWLLRREYSSSANPVIENDSIRLEGNSLIFLPSAPCCDIQTLFYEKVK